MHPKLRLVKRPFRSRSKLCVYNAMRILDQYLNPGMGPFPRKQKSSIDYVDLGKTSDEEKLIPHAESETSSDEYNQVSHLSFLTLAEKFGV